MAHFLGIDCSTQAVKATVINENLEVIVESAVNYDIELPEYRTKGGVHRGTDGDPNSVTTPPFVWIAALERVLQKLKTSGSVDLASIGCISGSGQQHGSVFWRTGARALLNRATSRDSMAPLVDSLREAFAVDESPIWMDSSTAAQCRQLETQLGGAQRVAELTGSRAYERFTRQQIQKLAERRPEAYQRTERISLVSSFVASLLLGDYAPVDLSDASGMNLLDLRRHEWAPEVLRVSPEGLAGKLAPPTESHRVLGPLAAYFVRRYGFAPQCVVAAFAGDNPNSVVGMRLSEAGDVSISLGTSDTLFATLDSPRPSADEGHLFCSPADPAAYMALVCYKNGSLTREDVRNRVADASWEHFSALLSGSEPGNGGRLGFYFAEPEITPRGAVGVHRFAPDETRVSAFSAAEEVRAVVEGQFLSMRYHAANIGIARFRSILVTGGASQNAQIVQVVANVFGVPVYTAQTANSAALGAAYRALHAVRCAAAGRLLPMHELLRTARPFHKLANPDPAAHQIYSKLVERYGRLEKRVLEEAEKK